jgi:hypothetical protein
MSISPRTTAVGRTGHEHRGPRHPRRMPPRRYDLPANTVRRNLIAPLGQVPRHG